jgi:hypothetical protein
MNSPKKSPGYNARADGHDNLQLGEQLASLQLLASLFPEHREDRFMLQQLLQAIERSIRETDGLSAATAVPYERIAEVARGLAQPGTHRPAEATVCIRIDLTGRTWDPLFISGEIIAQLKQHASAKHVFVWIINLASAMHPRRTSPQARKRQENARMAITDLVQKWTRASAQVHILFA